jgi:hypothetical protein
MLAIRRSYLRFFVVSLCKGHSLHLIHQAFQEPLLVSPKFASFEFLLVPFEVTALYIE